MNTTSVSLLERLRQPQPEEAWERFVRLYTPLLFYWARRTGLQESDAADLVQDVFALLLRRLPEFTYDSQRSFRAWLRTLTLNRWREIHRRRLLPTVAGDAPLLVEQAAPDEAEAVWDAEYRRHLLTQALELLEPEFQPATWRAFHESAVLGRPAAEVADALGISLNAVYLARSRVLRRLRQELAELLA
jgi:RNA polymerase sigma-70 factor (ECF subfamily)